jgi:hypothetical protein
MPTVIEPDSPVLLEGFTFVAGPYAGQTFGHVARDREGLSYMADLILEPRRRHFMSMRSQSALVRMFATGPRRHAIDSVLRREHRMEHVLHRL